MLETIAQFIHDLLVDLFDLSVDTGFIAKLLNSLLIFLLLWVVRAVVLRLVNRWYKGDTRRLYSARKLVEYIFVALVVLLVGRIWLAGLDTLATYLGLLSAGLVIALQDLIVSLAGWLFIIWRRPFVVGDRVQIGDIMGDVIDIRIFAFSLLEVGGQIDAEQSTGRIIHIPNSVVFKEPVTNTHQGLPYVWNEIPVTLTFESDWEKAKKLLNQIVEHYAPDVSEGIRRYKQSTDRFVISYTNISPTVYTSVVDSGVMLTLRYLVDPRHRRTSEQQIWESILHAFKPHWDIDFAYPTQREYIHYQEHKKKPDPQEAETLVAIRPKRPSASS
ncbi:MAG TPA: mechanosensitive ion channel [Anaerolineae bacterium]|nr:mechanosensitive ion channel [Anaerolineae bacterium]HIP71861.1 mechanosensitive ion channel [Anaerolineae bacterium]